MRLTQGSIVTMFDPAILAAIAAACLLGGLVKGVIGLGLPTVILAVLAVAIDLPAAMALLLAPSAVTNVQQALTGGHTRMVFGRIWPFLLTATATVGLGATALAHVAPGWLTGLLGVLLIGYATASLWGVRLRLNARQALWAGPLIGGLNGVFTGLTGAFTVPGIFYLQAIGLPRDALIQAMGMLFALSTLALAVALSGVGWLSAELGWLSLAGVAPAAIGMEWGRRIRKRLDERRFRRTFFIGIVLLGGHILVASLIGTGS